MVGQRGWRGVVVGSVREELAKLGEEVVLVFKQLGDLAVDFLFGQVFALTTGRGFFEGTLFLLVGMEDLEEFLVLLRLTLETVLKQFSKTINNQLIMYVLFIFKIMNYSTM